MKKNVSIKNSKSIFTLFLHKLLIVGVLLGIQTSYADGIRKFLGSNDFVITKTPGTCDNKNYHVRLLLYNDAVSNSCSSTDDQYLDAILSVKVGGRIDNFLYANSNSEDAFPKGSYKTRYSIGHYESTCTSALSFENPSATGSFVEFELPSYGTTKQLENNGNTNGNITIKNLAFSSVFTAPTDFYSTYIDFDIILTGTNNYWDVLNNNVEFEIRDGGYNSAINLFGKSEFSGNKIVTFNKPTIPDPTNFVVSQDQCGYVNLIWEKPSGTGCSGTITSYIDKRKKGTSTWLTNVFSSPTSTSWSDNSIAISDFDLYEYRLSVVQNGVASSYLIKEGKQKSLIVAPTGVTATIANCNSTVDVTWSAASGANGYHVFLKNATNTSIIKEVTVSASVSNYSFKELVPNQSYKVMIASTNGCSANGDGLSTSPVNAGTGNGPSGSFSVFTATQEGTNAQIRLNWLDNFNNETGFVIKKSFNGGAVTEISSATNTSTYLDVDVSQCVVYTYKIYAKNACDVVGVGGISSTFLLGPNLSTTFTSTSFKASKGFYSDRTELKWTNNNTAAIGNFRIFRQALDALGDSIQIASVTNSENLYIDKTGDANVLYKYTIIGEGKCGNNTIYSNIVSDIGFRSSFGKISGQVSYEGGIPVQGVKISAESDLGTYGKSINLNGTGAYLYAKHKPSLNLTGAFTLEIMFRLEQLKNTVLLKKSDFATLENNTFALEYYADGDTLSFYINNAGKRNSVKLLNPFTINEFVQITAVYTGDSLVLYKNGIRQGATKTTITPGLNASDVSVGGLPFAATWAIGYSLKGNLDEFKIWKTAKTAAQIKGDFSRSIAGIEPNLVAYWNFNEGAGEYSYDISRQGVAFNENHLKFGNSLVTWSNFIPTASQLSYAGFTSANGSYTITVPYSGAGIDYRLTPIFGIHKFDIANTTVFIGDGSNVINNQNFKDQSAFDFIGTVLYQTTDCPVAGANFTIDGKTVTKNGVAVVSNKEGLFSFQVPIGSHFITCEKEGHIFSAGRFPAKGEYDFQDVVPSAKFYDSTWYKLVGRVVGGTRDENKIIGFNKSKNNIGKAKLIFSAGCWSDTIVTNDSTGEYQIMLPPLKFNPTVEIISNKGIVFSSLDIIDMGTKIQLKTQRDTVFNADTTIHHIDSMRYNHVQNYIYRVDPKIDVTDGGGKPFIGDTVFTFINSTNKDTIDVNLRTNPMKWPVFTTNHYKGFTYKTAVKVFELYSNKDNTQSIKYDSVQVNEGTLSFVNDLSRNPNFSFDLSDLRGDSVSRILYAFEPGEASMLVEPNNPLYNFTKKFEINVQSGSRSASWYPVVSGDHLYRGYLLGSRDLGANFVTNGPEVVDFVLRDPPGSESFATLEKGASFTSSSSWAYNGAANGHVEHSVSMNLGPFGGFSGGAFFDVSYSLGRDGSYSSTYTTTETYETSSLSEAFAVGADADLYLGTSKNVQFGVVENLRIVPDSLCTKFDCFAGTSSAMAGFAFAKTKSLQITPKDYETGFIYTGAHIKNILLPKLVELRNAILEKELGKYESYLDNDAENYGKSNDDIEAFETEASNFATRYDGPSYKFTPSNANDVDSVRLVNVQIKLWEKAIADNEKEKAIVDDATERNQLKNKILDDLKKEYQATIANFEFLQTSGGIARAGAGIAAAISPIAGAIAFPIVSSLEISAAETQNRYQEYIDKKDEIYARFNKPMKNKSFSAGATYSSAESFEKTVATNWNVEFAMNAGLKTTIAAGGFEAENELSLSFNKSNSWGNENTETQTVAFTISDPDEGDNFVVDILPSIYGNGPIFKLKDGGQTKCPYEGATYSDYYTKNNAPVKLGAGTTVREMPSLSVAQSIKVNIPANAAATFDLSLGNDGKEDEEYMLKVIESSNKSGAIIKVDGLTANRLFPIPKSLKVPKVLTIEKGPGSVYSYDNIMLVLQSVCQPDDLADTIYLSAHFIPECANVSLLNPLDKWVLNNSFHDTLPTVLSGYDINFPSLKNIKLEYKPSNQSSWMGLETFWKDSIARGLNQGGIIATDNTYTEYNWEASQLADGRYDLRVMSNCLLADKTSPVYSGTIDRINPHPFGQPSPADGILSPNDEISIQFNEPIDIGSLTTQNFKIEGVMNGTANSHHVSLQMDGNDYLEVPVGVNLFSRSFSWDLWIKRAALGTEQCLLNQGTDASQRVWLGFESDNKLTFKIGNSFVKATNGTLADGQYHHVTVSYNYLQKTAELFVDGALANNGNLAISTNYTGNGKLFIGKENVGSTNGFKGNVHEVRVWNKAISLAESAANMNRVLTGREAGIMYNWKLDEGYGNAITESFRGLNAVNHDATWSYAPIGHARSFAGADHIEIDATEIVVNKEMDFTIEFWVNASAGPVQTLFSNGSGSITESSPEYKWSIDADASGKLWARHNGNNFELSSHVVLDGNWHHVALVLNRNANLTAYIDGNQTASTSAKGYGKFGSDKYYVAARGYRNGTTQTIDNKFIGKLDDIRIWNLARLQKQIERDRYNRLIGEEYGLVSYLPFEDYTSPGGVPTLTADMKDKTKPTRKITTVGTPTSTLLSAPLKLQRPVQEVPYTYSVNNDKIIFTISESFMANVENQTLDITVKNVKDLNGNTMQSPKTWVAFMDKNQVLWSQNEVLLSKEVNVSQSFSVEVINSGGSKKQFVISNLPSWLQASQTTGSAEPNSKSILTFTIPQSVNIGLYEQDIHLTTDYGFAEKLAIKLKVRANAAPTWSVDPANFQHSMSVIGQLSINNTISVDADDKIAAFVKGECRGLASVEYKQNLDKFYAFLNIYSNYAATETENIEFKIWDASTGKIHADISPNFDFVPDGIQGAINAPIVFKAIDQLEVSIYPKKGWSWISFNLLSQDSTNLNQLLTSINSKENDLIKGQNKASDFTSSNGWIGTLSALSAGVKVEESYKLKLSEKDTLLFKGQVIDPSTKAIDLNTGWNWIGFMSQRNQPIDLALSGLSASSGDIIKEQSAFAVYDATLGWVGSLTTMFPTKGYLYKSAAQKSFVYPLSSMVLRESEPNQLVEKAQSQLNYDEGAFENTMSLVAKIPNCGYQETVQQSWVLAAMKGNICHGVATISSLENLPYYFLSIGANQENESLSLKLINIDTKQEIVLNNAVSFETNKIVGSIESPTDLKAADKVCAENEHNVQSLSVYPVPFSTSLTIRINEDIGTPISINIYDLSGNLISKLFDENFADSTDYTLSEEQIKLLDKKYGVYLLEVITPTKRASTKVVYIAQ